MHTLVPERPAAVVRGLVAEAGHGGGVPPAALEQALGVVRGGDLRRVALALLFGLGGVVSL